MCCFTGRGLEGGASRPPFGDVATAARGQDAPAPGSPQADLAAARRLIEHHGYGRRLPELEDAEAALQVATAGVRAVSDARDSGS